jgi:hypothetical protein
MLLRAFAVALVAMCPLLASQTAPQPVQPAPQVGQPAPDFTLNDSAGAPVKLSAYKGESGSARLLGDLVHWLQS